MRTQRIKECCIHHLMQFTCVTGDDWRCNFKNVFVFVCVCALSELKLRLRLVQKGNWHEPHRLLWIGNFNTESQNQTEIQSDCIDLAGFNTAIEQTIQNELLVELFVICVLEMNTRFASLCRVYISLSNKFLPIEKLRITLSYLQKWSGCKIETKRKRERKRC